MAGQDLRQCSSGSEAVLNQMWGSATLQYIWGSAALYLEHRITRPKEAQYYIWNSAALYLKQWRTLSRAGSVRFRAVEQ
jgi:hypothetical protein